MSKNFQKGRNGFAQEDEDALLERQTRDMQMGAEIETERQLKALSSKAERLGYVVIPREEFETANLAIASGQPSAIIPSVGVRYTRIGIEFSQDINPEAWLEIVDNVASIKQAFQWMIGDLAVYASQKFEWGNKGEFYDELASRLEISGQLVRDWASVCRRVNLSERSDKLSFMHHAKVVNLPAEWQRTFLDWASENKLSVRQLELAVTLYDKERQLSADLLSLVQQPKAKPSRIESLVQSSVSLRAQVLKEASKKKNRDEVVRFAEEQVAEWQRLLDEIKGGKK